MGKNLTIFINYEWDKGPFQISTPQFCSAEISRVAIGMNIRFFATDDKSLEKNNVFVRIFDFAIFVGLNHRFLKKLSVSRVPMYRFCSNLG